MNDVNAVFELIISKSFLHPYFWSSQPVKPPEDQEIWGRLSIIQSFGRCVSLPGISGRRKFRNYGTGVLQVLFPYTTEEFKKNEVIDNVIKELREHKGDRIKFIETRISDAGQDGLWYIINIMSDFYFEETV